MVPESCVERLALAGKDPQMGRPYCESLLVFREQIRERGRLRSQSCTLCIEQRLTLACQIIQQIASVVHEITRVP